MRHYRLLKSIAAIGLLLAIAACQTDSTPTVTSTPPPVSTPTTLDTSTPQPSSAPTQPATPTQPPASSPTPSETSAANADVLHVRAVKTSDAAEGSAQGSTWTFHVTVEHPDTGWEDYADGWDVVTPDGTVLKPDPDSPFTRLLLHPHENEQPFTRSQSDIVIPAGVTQVRVRAHDLVDGYGGREVMVDLTADSGSDFKVER